MRTWAEIRTSYTDPNTGVVNGIHSMPDDLVPKFNPTSWLYVVETTGLDPQPAANWKYDLTTGVFSPPGSVYKTVLEVNEFWDRFTQAEKEAIVASTNPKIKTYQYDVFNTRRTINLEDAKTIGAINFLEANGFIAAGRAIEILVIEQS